MKNGHFGISTFQKNKLHYIKLPLVSDFSWYICLFQENSDIYSRSGVCIQHFKIICHILTFISSSHLPCTLDIILAFNNVEINCNCACVPPSRQDSYCQILLSITVVCYVQELAFEMVLVFGWVVGPGDVDSLTFVLMKFQTGLDTLRRVIAWWIGHIQERHWRQGTGLGRILYFVEHMKTVYLVLRPHNW